MYQLSPDATYVIAGGLGGLGRSAARWMVGKGVKNLILLSRSGPISKPAIQLLQEIRDAGVRAETPLCDVSNQEDLEKVINCHKEDMPPIKGCIISSMVLQVSLLFSRLKTSR